MVQCNNLHNKSFIQIILYLSLGLLILSHVMPVFPFFTLPLHIFGLIIVNMYVIRNGRKNNTITTKNCKK